MSRREWVMIRCNHTGWQMNVTRATHPEDEECGHFLDIKGIGNLVLHIRLDLERQRMRSSASPRHKNTPGIPITFSSRLTIRNKTSLYFSLASLTTSFIFSQGCAHVAQKSSTETLFRSRERTSLNCSGESIVKRFEDDMAR